MASLLSGARGVLNANQLRRLAAPLRARHPSAYARLNAVRKKVLSGSWGVDAYQANALRGFLGVAAISGARVLEIGSDPDMSVLRRVVALGASEAVGINNSTELWKEFPGGRIERGRASLLDADAAAIPFEDGSFDSVFSVATFEHILDLPRALSEVHRVLVPGGVLYTNFGPIWSGGKGHHLRVEVDGIELRHFMPENNPLPDFAHLLFSPEELRVSLSGRIEQKLIEPVVHWVYRDPGINRLFHGDYMKMFDESQLTVGRVRAEEDPVDPQLARILALRHPGESAFGITNLEVVLTKAGR